MRKLGKNKSKSANANITLTIEPLESQICEVKINGTCIKIDIIFIHDLVIISEFFNHFKSTKSFRDSFAKVVHLMYVQSNKDTLGKLELTELDFHRASDDELKDFVNLILHKNNNLKVEYATRRGDTFLKLIMACLLPSTKESYNANRIKQILSEGEGFTIEYKTCENKIGASVYETVCSFSNRYGGHLVLGADDNGNALGVDRTASKQMHKDFANTLNNPQKMSPLLYLSLEEVEIDGKLLLYTYVPPSAQVQSCNGKIFDRNIDGDQDITKFVDRVAQITLRKQATHTEREVFPYVTDNEIRFELVEKAKKMAVAHNSEHPWRNMTHKEILQSAGLIETDFRTGHTGYNLASILLFGRDDVIRSCAPGYMTDAIRRVDDLDRYDDRLMVGTNLIEAYEQLMDFISRHTLDRFFLVDNQKLE